MATVTDVLEVSDIAAAHGARLRQLGRSLGDKLDVDICAELGNFSTVVGASGVNLSVANILTTIYTLEAANAPKPYVGVVAPVQIHDLRTALEGSGNTAFQSNGIRSGTNELGPAGNGMAGSWFGLDFYFSTNVPDDGGSANKEGGVFSRNYALGIIEKWSAKVVPMYWPPIRGWVLVATANYGVFEIEDSAGVALITDK